MFGLKIISKIVTNRITKYAFEHKFVRPELFGFRNKEECIRVYRFLLEKYVKEEKNLKEIFTFLAFLDLMSVNSKELKVRISITLNL